MKRFGSDHSLLNRWYLYCGAALLLGSAVFSWSGRGSLLIGLMLFLPFFDRHWRIPALWPGEKKQYCAWLGLCLVAGALLLLHPERALFFVMTLALAALPEEWFFRAWFMTQAGSGWKANLLTSVFFALIHLPTQGPTRALLVFFPSLLYGWAYQRTRDLVLVILLHALSNLLYVIYLATLERDLVGWLVS